MASAGGITSRCWPTTTWRAAKPAAKDCAGVGLCGRAAEERRPQPAGSNGFYQPVKLVSREIDESGSSHGVGARWQSAAVKLGEDAMFSTRVDLAPRDGCAAGLRRLRANVPEKNYDDFAGAQREGQSRGDLQRLARGYAGGTGLALSVVGRARQELAQGRSHRLHHHPQSRGDGHSLEPHDAGPHTAEHVAGRSRCSTTGRELGWR